MKHITFAFILLGALSWIGNTAGGAAPKSASSAPQFQTADRCVACHNGMLDSKGNEYSIGLDWETSLMANSSRDPYWQASVRRETMDHGAAAAAAIEDECSNCHMPIPHYKLKQTGQLTPVLVNLPSTSHGDQEHADGVSCSVCHQIAPDKLGTEASFNGNFVIKGPAANGTRAEFGPYEIDAGLQQVMRSSTGGFEPQHGAQIQTPELCASCHTLITEARDAAGNVVGAFPEQMIYQEWQHSEFRTQRTCQSCHMPSVGEDIAVTRILGSPRPDAKRHQFVGANFIMQKILARYHDELNVSAEPRELYGAADRTTRYLQNEAAALSISTPVIRDGRLEETVAVENLGGHKLPTAYPSRRVWLHVVVRDKNRRTVFESGALNADGSIVGNDNDSDPNKYEAHYREIRRPDQVQIYESILGDVKGQVTTGLLFAASYLKDNRILPRGFDKSTAAPDIAVWGDALADPNFTDSGHTIKYSVELGRSAAPFEVDVELWYQPIGYRWANNLKPYDAEEPRRFTGYFDATGAGSAVLLVKASRATQ